MASEDYSPLLHGFKANKAYSQMKEQVFDACQSSTCSCLAWLGTHACLLPAPQFPQWARSEEHRRVADKLWQATGFKKIAPKQGLDKVLHLSTVAAACVDTAYRCSKGFNLSRNKSTSSGHIAWR